MSDAQMPHFGPTDRTKLDFTKDEAKRLTKAVQKPEFIGLMNDYMMEISDPNNKEEYDQYLKQLKSEGDLPKGMKLIQPEPIFCIKTKLTSQKDKNQVQKLFINICSAGRIPEPQQVQTSKGNQWQIPNSANKMRYDQTKKKEVCCTIDICFHPKTFEFMNQYKDKYQRMVAEIALESAKKQMAQRDEKVSMDFKILTAMKCKGGSPALLPIRTDPLTYKEQEQIEKRQGGEGKLTKLQEEIQGQRQKNPQNKDTKKEKENIENLELYKETYSDSSSEEEQFTGIAQPSYTVTKSYPIELQEFFGDNKFQNTQKPNKINYNIKLQKVQNLSEIQLDITEQQLDLQVKDIYSLIIKLPFTTNKDNAQAKWDKKKKVLKIILPIIYNGTEISNDFEIKGNVNELEESEIENILKEKYMKNTFAKEQQEKQQEQEKQQQEKQQQEQEAEQYVNKPVEEISEQQDQQDIQPIQEVQEKQHQVEQITYKLQQYSEQIFITFHVPNYEKDIKNIFFNNTFILISEQEYLSRFVEVSFKEEILQYEVKFLIDYISLIIHLKDSKVDEEELIDRGNNIFKENNFELVQDKYKLILAQKQEADLKKEVEIKEFQKEQQQEQQKEQQEQKIEQQPPKIEQIEQTEEEKEQALKQLEELKESLQNKQQLNVQFIQFQDLQCLNFESLD